MSSQDNYALAKFGIDEIYIHEGFTNDLVEKLYRRAEFSLDGEDNIVQKYTPQDMTLVFHKLVPSQSLIYRFLKFIHQDIDKQAFIESHTLQNVDELFSAIKSKKFVLITPKILIKETYSP